MSLLYDRYGNRLTIEQYSSQTSKLTSTRHVSARAIHGGNKTSNPYTFLSPYERRLINEFARDLFRSSPVIHSAINKKNEWACATAWKPIYRGSAKTAQWATLAKQYLLNVAYPRTTVNGLDFNRFLFVVANQLDIAGDVLLVLAKTRDNLGRIAIYPSNLIANRNEYANTVDNGRYKGAIIDDGVIQNSSGTPIAYRILQESSDQDFDVSVRDAVLLFEPTDLSPRGISVVAPSLLEVLKTEDIKQAINRTVYNESKQGLIVSTDGGSGADYAKNPLADDGAVTPTLDAPAVIELGDVTFVDARTGERIESLKTDRPHMNTTDWVKYVSETFVTDIGWALGLLAPSTLSNGTAARMVEAQVQQTIAIRQSTLKRAASAYTLYALSCGIANGDLPEINSEDWRAWDWSMPAEFVIDSYYSDQSDLAGLTAGTKTLQEVAARNGGDWEETLDQRLLENQRRIQLATELVKFTKDQGQTITLERALDLIGTGTKTNASPVSEQTITTA